MRSTVLVELGGKRGDVIRLGVVRQKQLHQHNARDEVAIAVDCGRSED